jgi:hypothetical protein
MGTHPIVISRGCARGFAAVNAIAKMRR